MLCDYIGYRSVGNALFVFLFCYVVLESGIQITSRLGIDDIPHLGLAEFVVYALCHLIVRMNLNAQVFLCIDEFYEQRHFVAVFFGHGIAQNLGRHLFDDVRQFLSFVNSVADYARTAWYRADFPTFANRLVFLGDSLVWTDALAAPDNAVKVRLEKQWV